MTLYALTAGDYSDWLQYAGLYLGNVSHTDRYRTFEPMISKQGLAAKIVFDFLDSNQGGIDLQTWRNSDVYEMPPEAKWRVEQTALSLEAIGAPRVAAKMRTLKNTSLGGMLMDSSDPAEMMRLMKDVDPVKLMEEFRGNIARAMPDMAAAAGLPTQQKPVAADADIETWGQVEHLLDRFVKSHENEMRGDMARHGDPRTEPGFDPDKRMEAIERLRRAEWDREAQREAVPKMTALMKEIDELLAKKPKSKPGRIAKQRRELLGCYRKYADRPADELLPEMQAWLKDAAAFQEKYSALFRPSPIDDENLLKRLGDLGAYDVDMGTKNVQALWDAPNGMTCDWTTFTLSLKYPIGDKKTLKEMLDACDRVRKNFAKHEAQMRQYILEHFNMARPSVEHFGMLDDYECDDEGNPTEESILKHADGGRIHLRPAEGDDPFVMIEVYFGVDWDEEHGLEMSIEDEPIEEPTTQAVAIANVHIHESGPAVNAEALSAFEKKYSVKLPAEYRSFLLQHNGGVPEPNHLKVKGDGGSSPFYVGRLFSILSDGSDNDLGNTFEIHLANDLPPHILPIGNGRMASPFGGTAKYPLLIALSGKKQGKVMTAVQMTAAMLPPGMADQLAFTAESAAFMAQMFEQSCIVLAPNFATFLSRLTPAPGQSIPEWLQAIRKGDAAAFVAAKPKLGEVYTPYGEVRMLTVLDYLVLEAPPPMLEDLARRGVVKPKELRESWQRVSPKIARFRQLMTVLGKDYLRFAFAAHDIWDDQELLNGLLAAKVDLEAPIGQEGETALHLAILAQRPDGVRWLLANGASASTPDTYGRTALLLAESIRHLESIKMLLEADEKIESLFPHMPTMADKLRLIKSRWMNQYDALAEYLRSRGIDA